MLEIAEYEQTLTDPNRFKIPGRMLKEEKVRKLMSKTLPSLEKKLRVDVAAFEKDNGTFSLDGISYIQRMDDERELKQRNDDDKKAEKSRNKAPATPSTPSKGRQSAHMSTLGGNIVPLISPRNSISGNTTSRNGNTTAPSTPRGGHTSTGRSTTSLTPRGRTDTFTTQSEKRTPNNSKYATLPASLNSNQKRNRDENTSANTTNQTEGKMNPTTATKQMGPSTGDAHSFVKRARVVVPSQTLKAPLTGGRMTSSGSTSGIKAPSIAAQMLLSKTASRIPRPTSSASSTPRTSTSSIRAEGEGPRRLDFTEI
jgi:hypothetical protein